MRRGHEVRILAASFAAAAMLLVGPASAHTYTVFYPWVWQSSVQTAGAWLYVKSGSGGLTTNQINRVIDAKQNWNNTAPTMWFNYKGSTANTWGSCAAPRNRNIVFSNYIDGEPAQDDTLAYAVVCPEG